MSNLKIQVLLEKDYYVILTENVFKRSHIILRCFYGSKCLVFLDFRLNIGIHLNTHKHTSCSVDFKLYIYNEGDFN